MFRRKEEVHLTPFQQGLKKAVSLNYFSIDSVQENSIDRMRNIGLLKIEWDGTIYPTERGKRIIDGTIETNETVPPFVAGLI